MGKRLYNRPVELILPNGKKPVLIQSPGAAVMQLVLKMGDGNCDLIESRNIRAAVDEMCARVLKKDAWKKNRKKRPLRPIDKLFLTAAKWSTSHGMTPKEAVKIFKDCGWQQGDPLPEWEASATEG